MRWHFHWRLVPPRMQAFDQHKQLVVGDVKCEADGLVIHLKWAKNLQRSDQYQVVRVPCMKGQEAFCPHYHFVQRVRSQGYFPTAPLVMLAGAPMTDAMLRIRMREILVRMNLSQAGMSFHAFRRTGITLAFTKQVPVQAIRAHGAWASNAVWQYLKHTDQVTKSSQQHWQLFLISLGACSLCCLL